MENPLVELPTVYTHKTSLRARLNYYSFHMLCDLFKLRKSTREQIEFWEAIRKSAGLDEVKDESFGTCPPASEPTENTTELFSPNELDRQI